MPIADEGDGKEENPAAPMLHVSIGRSSLLLNEIGNSVWSDGEAVTTCCRARDFQEQGVVHTQCRDLPTDDMAWVSWFSFLAVSSILVMKFRLVGGIPRASLRRLPPRPFFRQTSRPPVHCRRVASSSHMPPLCCSRVSLHCSGCSGARLFSLGPP